MCEFQRTGGTEDVKWLCLFLLLPGLVFAGEHCASMGGTCKASCSGNEYAEQGAFDDCSDVQECCQRGKSRKAEARCCIYSFDMKNSGKDNCIAPEDGECRKGTESPKECSTLPYCREK